MAQNHEIRDLMTENPRTVGPDASVVEAARVMRDDDVGLVPVVEGDRLVGTVTDRDIAIRDGPAPGSPPAGRRGGRPTGRNRCAGGRGEARRRQPDRPGSRADFRIGTRLMTGVTGPQR